MSETGRRRKQDEVDPELLALKVVRPGIGPLLALSVLALAVYLMIHWRADLLFALGAQAPRVVSLPQAGALEDNHFVTLTATPDLGAPARLRGQGNAGHRLVPVLGSSQTLWLQLPGEAASATLAYDRVYTGRLRRVASLSFAPELAAFVSALPPQSKFVEPSALLGGVPEKDVHGDRLSVSPDTPVLLEEVVRGVARVTVLKAGTIVDEAAARAALAQAGVLAAPGQDPVSQTDMSFTYEVAAPAGVRPLRALLGAFKLYAASVEEKVAQHRVPFREISPDATAKTIRLGTRVMALGDLRRAAFLIQPALPKDARMLLAHEIPASFWYVPIFYVALLLLCAAMVWALLRAGRPDRPRTAVLRPLR